MEGWLINWKIMAAACFLTYSTERFIVTDTENRTRMDLFVSLVLYIKHFVLPDPGYLGICQTIQRT